jgi:hypothetical protein
MVFVGYEVGTKRYRAYDSCTGCVHITYDATFDELVQWDSSREVVLDASTKPFEFGVTTMYMEQNADPTELALAGTGSTGRTPSPPPFQHAPPPTP